MIGRGPRSSPPSRRALGSQIDGLVHAGGFDDIITAELLARIGVGTVVHLELATVVVMVLAVWVGCNAAVATKAPALVNVS